MTLGIKFLSSTISWQLAKSSWQWDYLLIESQPEHLDPLITPKLKLPTAYCQLSTLDNPSKLS
jgi:hypothetical protein